MEVTTCIHDIPLDQRCDQCSLTQDDEYVCKTCDEICSTDMSWAADCGRAECPLRGKTSETPMHQFLAHG